MTNIGFAALSIVPSMRGIGGKLSTGISKEVNGSRLGRRLGDDIGSGLRGSSRGFGKLVAGGLAGAGAAVAGLGIGKALSGAITEASDLGESVNALNVTYGKSSTGIQNLGKKASTALGLSNVEFNNLAVRFSGFATTIAGDGGDVVGTLSDLTGRASDFASVMNLDVSKATELFQSGLAGETEPLRAFGIDLSAAAVEAYALREGIASSAGSMTEAEKVQARYGLLMESTAKTSGDFANTSDSLANAQRILGARTDDLKAKLGEALLPAMQGLVNYGGTKLLPFVEGLVTGFQDGTGAGGQIRDVLGIVGERAVSFGGFLRDDVVPPLKALGGFLYENRDLLLALGAGLTAGALAYKGITLGIRAYTVATTAANVVQKLLNGTMRANPIGLVVTGLGLLVSGVVLAYQKSETFRTIVQGAWQGIQVAADYAWNRVLKPVLGWLVGALVDGWEKFQTFQTVAGAVWEGVKTAFRTGVAFVVDKFLGMVGTVLQGAADAFSWVPGIGPKLREASDKFDTFRDSVNASLGGINDRNVKIRAELDATAAALVKSGVSQTVAKQRVSQTLRANGGSVFGEGTAKSDSIPVWLSTGEHVWSAAEVQGAGGHRAVEDMREDALHRATGGRIDRGLSVTASTGSTAKFDAIASGLNAGVAAISRDMQGTVDTMAAAARKQAAAAQVARVGSTGSVSGRGPGGKSVEELLAFARLWQSRGIRASENRALGYSVGKHSSTGYHYKFGGSGAVDFNAGAGESTAEKRRLKPLVQDALRKGFGAQFLAAGHYNHAHVDVGRYRAVGNLGAYDLGGVARGIGYLPKATPAPERVLSPQQTVSFDRLVDVLDRTPASVTATSGRPVEQHVHNYQLDSAGAADMAKRYATEVMTQQHRRQAVRARRG